MTDDRQAWRDAYRAAVDSSARRSAVMLAELRDARTIDYNYYGHPVKV